MSVQSFADLGVAPELRKTLNARGIKQPFAVQELVIRDALAGGDVIVRSPTGSGKTLAFALPLVQRIAPGDGPGAALVVAPTRELALQIHEEIRPLAERRQLRTVAVYGGAGLQRQAKLARRAQIVIATPGRLLDLMARGNVKLGRLKVLVLDEADRMLDMGFRPDVERIVKATPNQRQTMLFSATFDNEVARIAKAFTRDARRHESGPVEPDGEIEHRFIGVSHEGKIDALVDELRSERELALIFVRTKRGADRLEKRLRARGVKAVVMHGNKSQGQRQKALAAFDAGKVDALVATDVAARGIDVERISHVINFDPPGDHDTYRHRIGRTARAGRSGVGITLVRADEAHDVGKIAHELRLRSEFAEAGHATAAPPSAHGHRRRRNRRGHRGVRSSR